MSSSGTSIPEGFVTIIRKGTVLYHATDARSFQPEKRIIWFLTRNNRGNTTNDIFSKSEENYSDIVDYISGLYGSYVHKFVVAKDIRLLNINKFIREGAYKYDELKNVLSKNRMNRFAMVLQNKQSGLKLFRTQFEGRNQSTIDKMLVQLICTHFKNVQGIYSPPFRGKAYLEDANLPITISSNTTQANINTINTRDIMNNLINNGDYIQNDDKYHHLYTEIAVCPGVFGSHVERIGEPIVARPPKPERRNLNNNTNTNRNNRNTNPYGINEYGSFQQSALGLTNLRTPRSSNNNNVRTPRSSNNNLRTPRSSNNNNVRTPRSSNNKKNNLKPRALTFA